MSENSTCTEVTAGDKCMIRLYRDDCPGQLFGKCISSNFDAINGDEYFPAHFFQKHKNHSTIPNIETPRSEGANHLTPEEAYAGMLEMEHAGGVRS